MERKILKKKILGIICAFVVMAVSGWFTQFVIKRGKEAKK